MQLTKLSTLAALLVALAQPVVSTVYVTNPVASTKERGGHKLDVEWKDDGNSPKISDWGSLNIYLAVGSRTTQFNLQTLDTNVPTTKTSGRYKIDPSVGGNLSNKYFIRFESTKPGSDGKTILAFSALFSLSGMSGNFNSTVQAAIDGQTGTAITSSALAPSLSTSLVTRPTTTTNPAQSNAGAFSKTNGTNPALPANVANLALVSVGALAAGAGTYLL